MDILGVLNKKRAELIIILFFLVFILFLRIGQPWSHTLSHTYPKYFNANDNFLNSEFSDYVKNTGNYAFNPSYTAGGYKDVVGYLPPVLYHLSAMVSYLTGLETYVTTYLVVMFMLCSGYLLIYFAIRRVNETLALLSLPFMLGVFSFAFEIAYALGLWIFLTGSFFLMAFIWCMENFDRKYSFLLLALFLSGMALGHASELIFAVIFLVFYIVAKFLMEGFDKKEIKNLILSIVFFAAVSAYYLIVFYFTWMKTNPFTLSAMERPVFAPNLGVGFESFGATQFLLYAGILFFFFIFLLKEDSEKLKVRGMSPVILSAIFLLVMGFTNYIGFGVRAFQTRILWPVYLAILMGLAIYFIPAHFKKWRFRYAYLISGILLISFFASHLGQLQGGGIITQGVWDGFEWIAENTPEDSRVYHFYDKPMIQSYSLFSSKRLSFMVDINDYTEALINQIIKGDYMSKMSVLKDTKLPYRNSLFSYGYHADESDFRDQEINMWDMDYYFFAVSDPNPENALILYNKVVRGFLLNQTWIEEVYLNNEVSILKNNEPGRQP